MVILITIVILLWIPLLTHHLPTFYALISLQNLFIAAIECSTVDLLLLAAPKYGLRYLLLSEYGNLKKNAKLIIQRVT